ncbi:uncharacterized protein BDW43DRAFT_281683 [Aspergillus alliaceus]|uniref:uncharacterized protein n=1 Tax=Petromyces alliaceus TaxID=209559 RepID=UPI0012A42FC8|nr:uncharacterized protein BDW43DRAFT_281683 [Aspergillus alliaceus]KAB8231805.1 hypothetical protein BDW43DRAFT_281683 [Aspergillus alliaceus]
MLPHHCTINTTGMYLSQCNHQPVVARGMKETYNRRQVLYLIRIIAITVDITGHRAIIRGSME